MAGCRPRFPRATRLPPTGRCRGPRSTSWARRPFGFYVHVPFCTVRCGYCDFNTYTAEELGDQPGASRATYAEAAIAEVRQARRVLGDRDLPVDTVFFGGGTPTLLGPGDLASVLAAIAAEFGLAPDAEVTTEANPDSVAAWDLAALREAGFTRVSFGMQSAVDSVLATLDRTHDPLRVPAVVDWSREAGFEQVSLDLIYGTPGESPAGLGALRRGSPRVRARPRLGVLPDRRARHRPGPPGRPRRAADARRGRPRRQVPPRRRAARPGRLRVVRGVELGARPREPMPAQRALLDRRPLVGRRAGRPQPRRRRAVVERQAPRGVRRSAGRRRQPGRRARDARRRDATGRAGAARDPAA